MVTLQRKDAMAALLLGVTAGVIAIFAERADAIATGGNATPLGYINTYTWLLVSAVLFGPLGAIITTETQALVGLLTLANPLSWLWPFINLVFAATIGIVLAGASKYNSNLSLRNKLILLSATCAVLDIPLVYVVIVMVLNLPFIVYLGLLPLYIALQLLPSTILSNILVKAILKSKILGR